MKATFSVRVWRMWGSAMQMTGSWLVCMTLESSVCLCGFSSKWLQQKCVPHHQPYLVFTSVWTSAWLFQSWFRPRKLSVKPKAATMTSSLPSKPRKAKQKKSNGNWIIPGLWCRTESEGLVHVIRVGSVTNNSGFGTGGTEDV